MNKLFLVFGIFLFTSILNAQKDTSLVSKFDKKKVYVIEMNDGSNFRGKIIEDNARELLLDDDLRGKIYIPKYSIKNLNVSSPDNFIRGEYLSENKFPSLYMINSNALPFKPRSFVCNSYYFVGYSLNYAIDENFAVGLHSGIYGVPIGAGIKTSFKMGKSSFVGADLTVGYLSWVNPKSFGIITQAKYTSGTPNSNFTFGAGGGYGYAKSQFYNSNQVSQINDTEVVFFLNFSGIKRATKNIAFVYEGWLFPKQQFGMLGIGLRGMRKEFSSTVFGFYNVIVPNNSNYYGQGSPTFFPIPYLGWAFRL